MKMVEYIKFYANDYNGYECDEIDFEINTENCDDFIRLFNLEYDEIDRVEKLESDENDFYIDIHYDLVDIAKRVGLSTDFLNAIRKYKCYHKSPFSNSFYNADNIGWNFKPEGSIRISDHWNFESRGEKHCVVDFESCPRLKDYFNEDETIDWELVCKYEDGVYKVIEILDY